MDAGSTTVKGVVLNDDGELLYSKYLPSKGNPVEIMKQFLDEVYEINPEINVVSSAVTGYGEDIVKNAFAVDYGIVETIAHFTAAKYFMPDVEFIIDIGGQDIKAISIDGQGAVKNFLMNDKCAAGTGRFLEVISRTLGTNVEQLDSITENVTPHAITSMCTVFAESEVISLRSAGVAPEAILAGVINAMARRSANFIARLSCEAPILFTGGVSHCQRFTHMLESHLGMPVQTHPDAQFAGAIGAAVIGQRQRKRA